MKYSFFVILIFLMYGCKKDNLQSRQVGASQMLINGNSWTGEVRTYNQSRISFAVDKYKTIDGISVPWETFGIALFERTLDKTQIHNADSLVWYNPDLARCYASFSTYQADGDVGCDLFDVIEADSLDNWVQITREENNFGEVWGVFQVSLYRVNGCAASIYPDTLRLTNGTFHLVLE